MDRFVITMGDFLKNAGIVGLQYRRGTMDIRRMGRPFG